MSTLNPRQSAFVDEYIQSGNATQAVIRAGYSEKGARVQGVRMLTNANIQDTIEKRLAGASERADISVDWILGRLKLEAVNAESDGARVRALELLGKTRMIFAADNDNRPLKHEDLLDQLDAILDAKDSPPLIEHDKYG